MTSAAVMTMSVLRRLRVGLAGSTEGGRRETHMMGRSGNGKEWALRPSAPPVSHCIQLFANGKVIRIVVPAALLRTNVMSP